MDPILALIAELYSNLNTANQEIARLTKLMEGNTDD